MRKLSVHSALTDPETLVEILCDLPFLTHLTLDSLQFYVGPSFVHRLKMTDPPPLRHLEGMRLLTFPSNFKISDALDYIAWLNTTCRSMELDFAQNAGSSEARLRCARLETTVARLNRWRPRGAFFRFLGGMLIMVDQYTHEANYRRTGRRAGPLPLALIRVKVRSNICRNVIFIFLVLKYINKLCNSA